MQPTDSSFKKIRFLGLFIIFLSLLLNPFLMKIVADKLINPLINTNLNIFNVGLIQAINILFEIFFILLGLICFLNPSFIIHRKEFFKNVILFMIVFVVFLFILEFLNFLIITNRGAYYVWPQNLDKTYYPNSSILPGINGASHFTTNSLGYRGQELIKNKSEEYRILTIGGSTTECVFLDDSEIWSSLLEKYLNKTIDGKKIIVMNIGKSGHDTRDHILQLNYTFEEYQPDIVIMLLGVNDLIFTLRYGENWKPLDSDYSRAFSYSPVYSIRDSISYRSFKVFWGLVFKEKPIDPANYVQQRETRAKAPEINQLPEEKYLNRGLDYYESNLNKIINISREKNVTLLLMTQPYIWKENYSKAEENAMVDNWIVPEGHYSTPIMAKLMERYNQKLLFVCSENRDMLCLDISKKIPKNLDYFFDEVHYTEKGSDIIAQETSNFLKNQSNIF